jgi:hypothetical protein
VELQSLLGQDVPKHQFGPDLGSILVVAGLCFSRVVLGAVLVQNHIKDQCQNHQKKNREKYKNYSKRVPALSQIRLPKSSKINAKTSSEQNHENN